MNFLLLFFIFLLTLSASNALDCQQIPDSEIFAGDNFYFPVNLTEPTVLPANFNCTYLIRAPITSSLILMGKVALTNLVKGQNDRIIVTDSLGVKKILNYKSDSYLEYEVFPGKPMSIQVLTKSVMMNSEFFLHVSYQKVNIGPIRPLKTGGAMNFLDLSTLGGYDSSNMNSVTFQGNEPMVLSMAVSRYEWPTLFLFNSYVVDGDFYNQTQVRRLYDFVYQQPFVSTTNFLTIASFQKDTYYDTAVILNPISEAEQFNELNGEAATGGELNQVELSPLDFKDAVEVLAVQARQITVDSLVFYGTIQPNCVAQIVTGPPNNSSQLLLDLTKSQGIFPYTFKLKYFSVIAQNCGFTFTVTSPAPAPAPMKPVF